VTWNTKIEAGIFDLFERMGISREIAIQRDLLTNILLAVDQVEPKRAARLRRALEGDSTDRAKLNAIGSLFGRDAPWQIFMLPLGVVNDALVACQGQLADGPPWIREMIKSARTASNFLGETITVANTPKDGSVRPGRCKACAGLLLGSPRGTLCSSECRETWKKRRKRARPEEPPVVRFRGVTWVAGEVSRDGLTLKRSEQTRDSALTRIPTKKPKSLKPRPQRHSPPILRKSPRKIHPIPNV